MSDLPITRERLAQVKFDDIVTRIERQQAETRKFAAEQNKLAEEASKIRRDRDLSIWQVVATVVGASLALLAAGGTFVKLVMG